MSQLKAKLPTDTWVVATWDEYIQVIEDPASKKAKGYYRNGQMRIETVAVGPDHASDNTIITFVDALEAFRTAMSFRFVEWLNHNQDVFAAYKASLGFVWS